MSFIGPLSYNYFIASFLILIIADRLKFHLMHLLCNLIFMLVAQYNQPTFYRIYLDWNFLTYKRITVELIGTIITDRQV